jgi:hypothetical protein
MRHLHRRHQAALQGRVVLPDMLDSLSPRLYKEVVYQRGVSSCSTASSGRRSTTTEAVALPRVQFAEGRSAEELLLLVREGARPQASHRAAPILLWTDLLPTQGSTKEMSSPMWYDLSRRSLPALFLDGADSALLLRQQVRYPEVR